MAELWKLRAKVMPAPSAPLRIGRVYPINVNANVPAAVSMKELNSRKAINRASGSVFAIFHPVGPMRCRLNENDRDATETIAITTAYPTTIASASCSPARLYAAYDCGAWRKVTL
jgi:hypothetical protein